MGNTYGAKRLTSVSFLSTCFFLSPRIILDFSPHTGNNFLLVCHSRSFWWFDSISENIKQISPRSKENGSSAAKLGKVRKVVYGEAIASDEFNSSVITTVSWALYFAALTFLDRITNSRYAPIIVTFAIAGLILYRLDKSHRPAGETAHGFGFGARISIIAALVIYVLVIVHPSLGEQANMDLFPVQIGNLSHIPSH